MIKKDTRIVHVVKNALSIIFVLFLFFTAMDMLVQAARLLGDDTIRKILTFTSNPFISLFIGLIVTAIIQSSSTTTSMAVAMVASGSIDLSSAIPIVMGANIGTTITSNLVSLSFINKRKEFRDAFSAAITHDYFNIFATLLLFPLQYYYNFLGRLADYFTHFFVPDGSAATRSIIQSVEMSALSNFVYGIFDHTGVFFLLAIVLLFISIKQLSKIISRILIGNTQANFEKFVFHNRFKSFGWGVVITSLVQSSSVTTSLIVPLVATQKLKLQKAYPFILGANIGTTITAMLAALFKSGAAINLAVTHLLFNLIAVLVFLFIPGINKMPYLLAGWIGEQCEKRRVISVLFMIVTFFLIPFAFIYLSK